MSYRSLLIATAVSLGGVAVLAQAPEPLRFEVVSIKRNLSVTTDGGMQDLLGGAFEMRNEPITSILSSGSPVRVRGVEGIPDWAKTERYDIIAKPASAITGRQQNEMMRNLLIDRFKLSGHVEQRERDVFNLVLARQDGRLGIGMARSTLDCANSLASGADDPRKTCGASVGANEISSGGTPISGVLPAFGYLAGGWPAFPVALQEQLGLKLEPTKAMEPVFVIDHLERPTPD